LNLTGKLLVDNFSSIFKVKSFSLNFSALIYNQHGKLVETVSSENHRVFVQLERQSSGARLKENKIHLDLDILLPVASFIVFTSSLIFLDKFSEGVFSKDVSFLRVEEAFMKMKDEEEIIANIKLTKSNSKSVAWGILYQNRDGWYFETLDVHDDSNSWKEFTNSIQEDFINERIKKIIDPYLNKSLNELILNHETYNFKDYEKSRFFFSGKPTNEGNPVYYVILNRLDENLISAPDKFVVFLYEMMKDDLDKKFIIVVDASWEKFSKKKYSFLSIVRDILRLFQDHIPRCKEIFIVQPNPRNMKDVESVVSMIESKMKETKIKVLHDWQLLVDILKMKKIGIPITSKKFYPITYKVLCLFTGMEEWEKIHLKLTQNSILFIDPEQKKVFFEMFYSTIEAMCCRDSAPEIYLQYKETSDKRLINESRKKLPFRLLFESDADRDLISELIYNLSIHSLSLVTDSTFQVNTKKNVVTHNYVKVTHDSIIYFKLFQFNLEIPFTQISALKRLDDQLEVTYFQNGVETYFPIFTEKSKELKYSIEDAITRYYFHVDCDIKLFKVVKEDSIATKFFETALKSRIKDDLDSEWKKIYYFEALFNDLEKLFAKFQPDEKNRGLLSEENMFEVANKCNLTFSEDEIEHMIQLFNHKENDFLEFNNLLMEFIYFRKERDIVLKKRQLSSRRSSTPNFSPKSKSARFKMSPRITTLDKARMDEEKAKALEKLKIKQEEEKNQKKIEQENESKELDDLKNEVEKRLQEKKRKQEEEREEERKNTEIEELNQSKIKLATLSDSLKEKTKEIETLKLTTKSMEKILKSDDEEILRLNSELEPKTEEVSKLKLEIGILSERIKALEELYPPPKPVELPKMKINLKLLQDEDDENENIMVSPKAKDLIKKFSVTSPRVEKSTPTPMADQIRPPKISLPNEEKEIGLSELKKNLENKDKEKIAPWQRELLTKSSFSFAKK
jgi:flagellar biosynthesis GTPase FlhF